MGQVEIEERRHQIPPLDRTGMLMGFGFAELILAGVVGTVCVFMLQLGVTAWVYAPLFLGALVLIRKPWPGGLQLAEYWPIVRNRFRTRGEHSEWKATTEWDGVNGDLPSSLSGLQLVTVRPVGYGDVGVAIDSSTGAGTFVVELGSTSFLLEHPKDQESLLDRWGRTIAASVVSGRTQVRHVSFTLISSQGSPDDHAMFVRSASGEASSKWITDDYHRLIRGGSSSSSASHRILFSVTVGQRKASKTAGWGLDETDVTDSSDTSSARRDHYLEIARTVTSMMRNLSSVGWTTQEVLSKEELLAVLGECVDPATRLGRVAQADSSLDGLVGLGARANPPKKVITEREFAVVNGVAHRTYWVREWPNYGMPAEWLVRLLSEVAGERRFTMYFRPIPKSKSMSAHDKAVSKHEGDALAAEERGKVVTLKTRKAQETLADLGDDLMAGYPEVEMTALITISGPNPKVLREQSETFVSQATSNGVTVHDLRDGHNIGWAHTTPLGLCPIKTRSEWTQ